MAATVGAGSVRSWGPGAFFCVSHMGVWVQGLEPFSPAFPNHNQKARRKVEQLKHELASLWDATATSGRLACYTIVLARLCDYFNLISALHYMPIDGTVYGGCNKTEHPRGLNYSFIDNANKYDEVQLLPSRKSKCSDKMNYLLRQNCNYVLKMPQ